MALAAAISKQPAQKVHSLETMRLTIGFLAIGSPLIRVANAEERRWSGLWPPIFGLSEPAPELLAGQSLPSFANFRFGRAQTDSIVDGGGLTQFM
jgi:hypothetical protein